MASSAARKRKLAQARQHQKSTTTSQDLSRRETDPPVPGAGQMSMLEIEQRYEGPIPMASEMRQYEEVLPGLADRLVTMAEKQSQHRRRLETMDVALEHFHVGFGQLSALVVALFFGWVAWDLGQDGEPVLAAFIGAVDLVALVGVFIYGKRQDGAPGA